MPRTTLQAGHSPAAGTAPGRLETVRLFVNTRDIELGTDELSTPQALVAWLAANRLLAAFEPAAPGPAGVAEVGRAVAVREALRGVLLSHVSTRADPASRVVGAGDPVAELRRIAGTLSTRLAVSDDGQVCTAPAGTGVSAALAAILLIAAEASVAGTWSRLKVCGADDCRWAFYDRSPTRNGCWCSMAVCGARAKSRAYRRRAAARR